MNTLRVGTQYNTCRPISEFLSAWVEAKKVGHPLNTLISFKPSDTNARSSSENGKLWAKLRNKLSQFARNHDFEATFVWSRETSKREGKTWPKQAVSPYNARRLMLDYQTGGVTVGKRIGFTVNLSPKAIEARVAAKSQSLRVAA